MQHQHLRKTSPQRRRCMHRGLVLHTTGCAESYLLAFPPAPKYAVRGSRSGGPTRLGVKGNALHRRRARQAEDLSNHTLMGHRFAGLRQASPRVPNLKRDGRSLDRTPRLSPTPAGVADQAASLSSLQPGSVRVCSGMAWRRTVLLQQACPAAAGLGQVHQPQVRLCLNAASSPDPGQNKRPSTS